MAVITTGTFPGPAGRLEYILNVNESGAPATRAALVCHPHPAFGGTMHTKIVFQAAQELVHQGLPVLRFHFRGVGKSEGAYDHGHGERDDLEAALLYLRSLFPLPVVLAGFSFGATMVTKALAAAPHPEVAQAILMGLPVDRGPIATDWRWHGPKAMISGDHDEYAAVPSLEAYFERLPEPKVRHWIQGGDHFIAGHHAEFRAALAAVVARR
ncbi:MAG TPA: alpha/beta fold hydrolase [Terriglobales bacterium]|nr:alpha/beta fold hydrolase [Terriglobales bacterium]